MSNANDRPSSYRVQFESSDVRLARTGDLSTDSTITAGELDEETIRWGVLITRIICIVLVCVIIGSVAFGETTHPEVLLLAALCGCVLIVVFMCSFVDIEALRSQHRWTGKFFRASGTARASSGNENGNNGFNEPINEMHRRSDQI